MYKKDFPIFDNNTWLVFLDSSSTTQKPLFVIEETSKFIWHSYANIHRWMYDIAVQSEDLYNRSKKKVAEVLWCNEKEIIYWYNATHLSNMICSSLCESWIVNKGDTVLVGIRDHHATIVPLQLLAKKYNFNIEFIQIDDNEEINFDSFDQQYNKNVKAVVCSMVSNVTWTIFDLNRLQSKLRDDTFFIVDGSQAIPHFTVNVNDLWCDAFIFTWHKVFAYTGIWVMFLAKKWIKELAISVWGWWTVEKVTVEWCEMLTTTSKYEAWTPNIIAAVSLLKAFEYIDSIWWYAEIMKVESNLVEYILVKFKESEDILELLWQKSHRHRVGVFSWVFVNKKIHIVDANDELASRNIALRCGGHCAHPLISHYWKNGVCRISTHIYNTKADIDKFFEVIREISLKLSE